MMPALNSVTTPSGVIRPIRLPLISVNHRLPSGPAVMSRRLRTGGDAGAELGDDAERGNPPDPVAASFREPQVAIGAGRDAVRVRTGGDAGAELGDDAERGNPPDPVAVPVP